MEHRNNVNLSQHLNKNFACTGQLIVTALTQVVKVPPTVVTRLMFWFGLFALVKVSMH